MTERGLFVTFEGLDGCGKSTQLRRLAADLRSASLAVIETAEPGGTAIGQGIRRILLDPANTNMAPTAEMLLYFAARAQNVAELVEPALARGEIVLSDRWTDSTFAYQGFGRGLGAGIVDRLDEIACAGRKPDLTLWVDIDLETSLQRARKREMSGDGSESRFEAEAALFFEKVRAGYQALVEREPSRVIRVDGQGSVEEVYVRVRAAFDDARRRSAGV